MNTSCRFSYENEPTSHTPSMRGFSIWVGGRRPIYTYNVYSQEFWKMSIKVWADDVAIELEGLIFQSIWCFAKHTQLSEFGWIPSLPIIKWLETWSTFTSVQIDNVNHQISTIYELVTFSALVKFPSFDLRTRNYNNRCSTANM